MRYASLLLPLAIGLTGCVTALDYAHPAQELVLSDKEEFPFSLPAGSGKIIADGSRHRTVIFNGKSYEIGIHACHSRFWGRMGAQSSEPLFLAEGEKRILYDESEMRFSNKEEIQTWLNGPWNKNHGRLTGDVFCLVCETPARRQINVSLHRIIYSPRDGFRLSMFQGGKESGDTPNTPTANERQ